MVLMSVHNSEGCVGRCDARCYNAKHPECDCICHGMNHGKGRDRAIENTQFHAEKMIEKYAEEKRLSDFKSFINQDVRQSSLLMEMDAKQ